MVDPKIRMEIYMGLAAALDRPQRRLFGAQNEHSLPAILSSQTRKYLLSGARRPAAELFAFITKNAQNGDAKFWQDLEIEYNRLFVGPYSPQAHPNESVYRNPYHQPFDECVLRICQAYDREGLIVRHSFHDLPDHIVAELEFVAILCERELEARQNNRPEKALGYLLKQYDFLVEHLGTWTPEFSSKIESNTHSPFYHCLAAVLRKFISDEVDNLADEICKQEAKARNSPAISRDDKVLISPPGGNVKGERGDYLVEINSYDCILCGVCTSSCPTKAFRIADDQQSIRLLFKAELCNGCKQCLGACPAQAIKLSSGYDHSNTGTRHEWLEVATAQPTRCSGCGKVHSPDKMQQRVLASFSKEEFRYALFEMLSLCPTCKRKRLMDSYYQGAHTHQAMVRSGEGFS